MQSAALIPPDSDAPYVTSSDQLMLLMQRV